jgi:hypothetical protein
MKTLTVALILFASLAHAACPEIPQRSGCG